LWDFRLDLKEEANDYIKVQSNELKLGLIEDIIREKIKNRPRNEKIKLFFRRQE
jgi:hypothetical protein